MANTPDDTLPQGEDYYGLFHTQETDLYGSRKPYDFNGGGKGLDLLLAKIYGQRFGFDVLLDGRRNCMSKKDHLIDLLIHDLSGPISIASTSTHSLLIKEDKYGPLTSRQRQTLERILRNANKAQTLLTEMVEVYRSEEGLFRCSSFLITEVLNESIMDALDIVDPVLAGKLVFVERDDVFYRILEENRVFVECTGRHCQTPFYHDRKKLQQVLRNLISNALKYCKERVTISITGDSDLVIVVRDDGPGIPRDELQNIFKRFGILKGKTKEETKTPGFGFGMSCVKILVDVMGGEINLESNEGNGTCFTVRVPPLQLLTDKEVLK